MQASDSVRSLATDNYNAAAKKFVTREFESSLELLEPLASKSGELLATGQISKGTRAKIWMLYSILHESGFKNQGFSWDSLLKGYSSLGEVESEVVLAAAKAIVKTSADASQSASKIEEYFSLKSKLEPSDMLLVTFLVCTVLPKLEDYEYAIEFARQCSLFSDSHKDQLVSQITLLQNSAIEAELKSRQLEESRLKEEQERVQKIINAQQEALVQQESLSLSTTEISSPARARERRHIAQNRSSLTAHFKQWILACTKSRGLQNGILFLLLLLTLSSNHRFRAKLRASGQWVWECAKHAAKMGMTVTYF